MRICSATLAALLVFVPALFAQDQSGEKVPRHKPEEAKDLIGKEAVIRGKIAEVSKAEKVIRLNFEKSFPDQPFTAVIFSSSTNRFKDLDFDSLKGKTAEVTGKVTDYRGKPQIVINTPANLKVMEGKSGEKQ